MTSSYSMGLNTYQVPLELYATNRQKLVSSLRHHYCDSDVTGKVVYLEGGKSTTRHSSDHEPIFRQESYFHYVFGVRDPDYAGAIEVDTGRAVLFIPRLPEDYATVMGKIKSCNDVREEYGVDEVRYLDDVETYLVEVVGRSNNEREYAIDSRARLLLY